MVVLASQVVEAVRHLVAQSIVHVCQVVHDAALREVDERRLDVRIDHIWLFADELQLHPINTRILNKN